jgi:hypothetical protein
MLQEKCGALPNCPTPCEYVWGLEFDGQEKEKEKAEKAVKPVKRVIVKKKKNNTKEDEVNERHVRRLFLFGVTNSNR